MWIVLGISRNQPVPKLSSDQILLPQSLSSFGIRPGDIVLVAFRSGIFDLRAAYERVLQSSTASNSVSKVCSIPFSLSAI